MNMRRKKTATCYMCPAVATTREHAPPQCFFPEGYRKNLFVVPSCPLHNLSNSEDVEYVRNVICGQRGTNDVASLAFETAKRSYDHTPALFARTLGEVRTIVVDGEETGSFPINLRRHRAVMKAIVHALYYRDTGRRHDGDFGVFSPSMVHPENLYHGRPDPADGFRRYLESGTFEAMPVPEPKVFKYGVLDMGEGQLLYRFEFYESFVVNAWTRTYRLGPYLYLPVGTVWMCSED